MKCWAQHFLPTVSRRKSNLIVIVRLISPAYFYTIPLSEITLHVHICSTRAGWKLFFIHLVYISKKEVGGESMLTLNIVPYTFTRVKKSIYGLSVCMQAHKLVTGKWGKKEKKARILDQWKIHDNNAQITMIHPHFSQEPQSLRRQSCSYFFAHRHTILMHHRWAE